MRNISTLPTAGAATTYTYDNLNRLVKVVNSAGTSQYVYGAGYDRIQKITPGGHVRTYLGQLAEVTETGAFTDYIFAGDTRVATVDTSGVYYHSNDHLSSASLITNASAGVVQKLDYYPFGSERLNEKFASFETRFSFTDQEKDAETGLMYYGARYYDPVIGRFTSVDPVVIDTNRKEFVMALANPQLLNAYSYVGNNPLKYVDPSGEGLGLVAAIGIAIVTGVLFSDIKMAQAPAAENCLLPGSVESKGFGEIVSSRYNNLAGWQQEAIKSTAIMITLGRSAFTNTLSNTIALQVNQELRGESVENAYKIASQDGKHFGTLMNYSTRSVKELMNAIKSYGEQVKLHLEKIANPEQYIDNYDQIDPKEIVQTLKKWGTDAVRNKELQNVIKGLLEDKTNS